MTTAELGNSAELSGLDTLYYAGIKTEDTEWATNLLLGIQEDTTPVQKTKRLLETFETIQTQVCHNRMVNKSLPKATTQEIVDAILPVCQTCINDIGAKLAEHQPVRSPSPAPERAVKGPATKKVKYSSHFQERSEFVKIMFKEGVQADVRFHVDGHVFNKHRVFLRGHSKKFDELIAADEVFLEGSIQAIRKVLYYLYTRELNLSISSLLPVSELAAHYDLLSLSQKCDTFYESIKGDYLNLINLLKSSEGINQKNPILQKAYSEVLGQMNIDFKQMIDLLSIRPQINPEKIFMFALSWLNANSDQMDKVDEILSKIDCKKVPLKTLLDILTEAKQKEYQLHLISNKLLTFCMQAAQNGVNHAPRS